MDFFSSRHSSVKIAYSKYPAENPRYNMLFLTGRAEFFKKYEFLFEILNNFGGSVYAMDHRGQGASGRMLGDPRKGYVEKFSYYVDDAEDFVHNIIQKDAPGKPLLSLSHSMGGAVSLLLADRHRKMFERMVFSSPMWGINLGFLSQNLAYIISRVTVLSGKGEDFLPGKGEYRPEYRFENNRLTQSFSNYRKQIEFLKENPSFFIGGPTYLWLHESLKAIRYIINSDIDIGCPSVLLQAGKDSVVDNKCQDKVLEKLRNCSKFVVEGSLHEILYEDDKYFQPALKRIEEFFCLENTT